MVEARNYRPNVHRLSFAGSRPTPGQVLADLHDENGNFVRTAVVADCGDQMSAQRYAKERNDHLNRTTVL